MRRSVTAALALAAFATAPLAAQSADEKDALATLTKLFDGMRGRDTALMRSVFVPGAQLSSVGGPNGLNITPVDRFIEIIAKAPPGKLDERIQNAEVHVDGALAAIWTYYTFNLDGKMSHCGVDVAWLRKGADGWKIFQLADTRRKEPCTAI